MVVQDPDCDICVAEATRITAVGSADWLYSATQGKTLSLALSLLCFLLNTPL